MKTFYVTFGMGSLLRGYHAKFSAMNEDIVRAYMNKKARIPWSAIYPTKPAGSKALQRAPEVLFYQDAAHV